ncbi:MAG: nucleotide sugar dehydrogenase [Opitutales bacterium]|nr:nucleotide sugar dehydrogenase [Opitutales bacterium]
MKIKNITCIGAGYVGGPTMSVIADRCPDIRVTVVDMNADRIAAWNSDHIPIFEPGLDVVVKRARGKNLFFSTDIDASIKSADCIFMSVNTPTKTEGEGAGRAADLKYIIACAEQIARSAQNHTIVVEKSTLPVRTAEKIKEILAKNSKHTFDVLSNPEFLAEGTAVKDLENPDRVLIGGENPEAIAALSDVYAQWVAKEKIITTNVWSAEMAKLAANAMLAQRVSSINSLSAFCEATEADIDEVAKVLGSDSRIGPKFLKAGIGFGGSCFQKDILNLVYLCEHYGLTEVAAYWEQVIVMNEWQKKRIAQLVIKKLGGSVKGKKIAVLGFAFKKDTNDTREAPAISVCETLLKAGAEVVIFDPKVSENQVADDLLHLSSQPSQFKCVNSASEACLGADTAIVLTEWDQFKSIEWLSIALKMSSGAWVFDARNCTNHTAIRAAGLNLWVVGKSNQSA